MGKLTISVIVMKETHTPENSRPKTKMPVIVSMLLKRCRMERCMHQPFLPRVVVVHCLMRPSARLFNLAMILPLTLMPNSRSGTKGLGARVSASLASRYFRAQEALENLSSNFATCTVQPFHHRSSSSLWSALTWVADQRPQHKAILECTHTYLIELLTRKLL